MRGSRSHSLELYICIARSNTSYFGHQANELCEQHHLTLMNSLRSKLNESGLDHAHRHDAARQACRILNTVPKQVLGNKSSCGKLTKKDP